MVDVIITDEGIKKEMKEALEERGIKVIVAAADA
jgi:DeoR/GlpR family transcriptional regulator of sugar metabolism